MILKRIYILVIFLKKFLYQNRSNYSTWEFKDYKPCYVNSCVININTNIFFLIYAQKDCWKLFHRYIIAPPFLILNMSDPDLEILS